MRNSKEGPRVSWKFQAAKIVACFSRVALLLVNDVVLCVACIASILELVSGNVEACLRSKLEMLKRMRQEVSRIFVGLALSGTQGIIVRLFGLLALSLEVTLLPYCSLVVVVVGVWVGVRIGPLGCL
jgi:hypothetical protein